MKKPIKIEEEDLLALHKKVKEQEKYIKKLEKALDSVQRQVDNAKATKNE